MTRKFAPIAMLFGMLSALLLGGAGMAQAASVDFKCNQGVVGVNVLSCNEITVKDISVEIKGNRVLNDNEIIKVENVLENNNVLVFEDKLIALYDSFNPSIEITKNEIQVCTGLATGAVVCK